MIKGYYDIIKCKINTSNNIVKCKTFIPEPKLQSKSIKIIENGDITVKNDDNYDGLKDIKIDVDVPQLDTSDATATAIDIKENETAYVNGQKITGTLPVLTYPSSDFDSQFIAGDSAYTKNRDNTDFLVGTFQIVPNNKPDSWMFEGNRKMKLGIPYNLVSNKLGITADKIKKDETIAGVTGTYEAQPNLQYKSITRTANGTYNIEPDTGYDGMSEVEVFVDVPEPSGTISITENGTYNVASYANASVNVQSGGDLFATDYAYTKSILSNWDSTETNMESMFSSDTNLKYMPVVDTSNVTTVSSAFTSCSNLIYIPKLNFAEATLMNNTFYGCSKLIYVGDLNTPKVINTSTMFHRCSSLIEAPMMDLSEVTSLQSMFKDCTNLVTIPLYNTVKAKTSFNHFATNCPNLSNESLNNILAMCTMSAVTSSTKKTLKKVGLSSTQAATCQTLSNWSAFAAAGWTTGY